MAVTIGYPQTITNALGAALTHFAGKTVLITGAGTGIGRRLALSSARRGATVVAWDLAGDKAEEVVQEIKAEGGRAHAFSVDVSDRQAVADVAQEVLTTVGPVDILVNNAGIVSGAELLDLPDEKIEKTFGVNVLALYWCTKAFLPEMKRRGSGHIVTVASAAGMVGVAKQTDYSASKHAAIGFDESLRAELRSTAPGVRTTVVCPFYINTGMFDGVQSRIPALLPILDQDEATAKIVKAIEGNKRRLVMPPAVALLPPLRILPVPVFDKVMDILGVNVSMKEFKGRG